MLCLFPLLPPCLSIIDSEQVPCAPYEGVMLHPRATETVLLPKQHTALVLPSPRTARSTPIRTSVFSESAYTDLVG